MANKEKGPRQLILEGKVARAIEARAIMRPGLIQRSVANRRRLIRLAMRDGKKCFHCGGDVVFQWDGAKHDDDNVATFDHVITQADGGTWDDENGVLACNLCNGLRSNKSVEEFQAELALYDSPRDMRDRIRRGTRVRKTLRRRDAKYRMRFHQVLRQREFQKRYSLVFLPPKPLTTIEGWKSIFVIEKERDRKMRRAADKAQRQANLKIVRERDRIRKAAKNGLMSLPSDHSYEIMGI